MLKLRTIGYLTILKVIGILLNVAYYMLQVDCFGITRTIENYFVAYSLLVIGLSLTIAGFLGEMLLPLIHEQQQKYGNLIVDKTTSIVINWLLLFTTLYCIVLYLFSVPIVNLIAPGFSEIDQQNIVLLFRSMVFSLILQVINIIFNSYFHAREIYGRMELVIIIRVLVSIVLLTFFFESLGIWALVLSVWAQQIISAGISLAILIKIKFRYSPILSVKEFNHQLFFKEGSSAYFLSFSQQLFQFVLTAIVSYLPVGVYAAFKYVENIMIRIVSVVLSPTTTVFFTDFSNAVNAQSTKVYKMVRKAHNYSILISAFTVLTIVSFGSDLLYFLWGDNYNLNNSQMAYGFLAISASTLFLLSNQNLFNGIALVYKKTRMLYFYQGLAWLLATCYSIVAIKYFQVWGLGSVIFINVLFTSSALLFLMVKQDQKLLQFLDYSLVLKTIFIVLLLLVVGHYLNACLSVDFNSLRNRINALFNLSIKSLILAVLFGLFYLRFGLRHIQDET